MNGGVFGSIADYLKAYSPRRVIATLVLYVLAFLLVGQMFLHCHGIGPRAYTRTTMSVIKRRIMQFAHENGRLPNDLQNLPSKSGYTNRLTDWWGNAIEYEADADGIVTLRSPGGKVWFRDENQGRPLTCTFPSKDANGQWSAELVAFTREE